jgi:hypothetical protein
MTLSNQLYLIDEKRPFALCRTHLLIPTQGPHTYPSSTLQMKRAQKQNPIVSRFFLGLVKAVMCCPKLLLGPRYTFSRDCTRWLSKIKDMGITYPCNLYVQILIPLLGVSVLSISDKHAKCVRIIALNVKEHSCSSLW